LVIGGGGREHALVWKLKPESARGQDWCVPGNRRDRIRSGVPAADPANVAELVALAERLSPDLTIVGPELPLVNGIGDAFRERSWPIVAPSQQAAKLEGSKVFAKEFLERHHIPTAKMYGAFENAEDAVQALLG